MTNASLTQTFHQKQNLLWEMLENGIITEETYDATLNRVKNETFFAVDVMSDIDNINDEGARPSA